MPITFVRFTDADPFWQTLQTKFADNQDDNSATSTMAVMVQQLVLLTVCLGYCCCRRFASSSNENTEHGDTTFRAKSKDTLFYGGISTNLRGSFQNFTITERTKSARQRPTRLYAKIDNQPRAKLINQHVEPLETLCDSECDRIS